MMRTLTPHLIRVAIAALVAGWQLARQQTLPDLWAVIFSLLAAAVIGWELRALGSLILREMEPQTRADRRAMRKITELVQGRTGAAAQSTSTTNASRTH